MGLGVAATSIRERVRPVVTAVLIGAAVMGAISLVTGLGWGWLGDLSTPGSVRSWLAPATGSGIFVTDIMHVLGIGIAEHSVLSVTRLLGLVAALVLGVWLLLRAEQKGSLRAIGLTLLLVVLLAPVVQPWYLLWGLVLLAPVATGWIKRLLIVLSVGGVFLGLPGGEQLLHDLRYSNRFYAVVALLVLLVVFIAPLGKERRSGSDVTGRLDVPDLPREVEAFLAERRIAVAPGEMSGAVARASSSASYRPAEPVAGGLGSRPHAASSGSSGLHSTGFRSPKVRPTKQGFEHAGGPAASLDG